MEDPEYTLDDILKNLDTINDFCDQRTDSYYRSACNGCPLNDYCIAIPTRSSFEDLIRHAKRCAEIVKDIKGKT